MSRIPQAALDKKKFDVISRIWGAILLLLKWVKRTKHSCRQPQAKKCQGSKSSKARLQKCPQGAPTPFFIFWDSNVLKWEFTVKSMDWTNSLTRVIFFPRWCLRLMRYCYAAGYISDVNSIYKMLLMLKNHKKIRKSQSFKIYRHCIYTFYS